jgi:hypothetical protein
MIDFLMQENADVHIEAKKLEFPQPVVLVRGEESTPKDSFICTEGQILCEVPLDEIPFILLAVFYAFNMQYTIGCTNFLLISGAHIPRR